MAHVFGPVISRRFGLSLGINHLPKKVCTYSCVYCQLGRTWLLSHERKPFSDPEEIYRAVHMRLNELKKQGKIPNVLTFVSNGEPTLDSNLGEVILRLKSFNIPIAVITNGSLIHLPEIRNELLAADIVSVKVDSVREQNWREINRPHTELLLVSILEGLKSFSADYKGKLITETMIIYDINHTEEDIADLSKFIKDLHPLCAYLAIPLRPPAEKRVKPPDANEILHIYGNFSAQHIQSKLMTYLPINDLTLEEQPIEKLLEVLKVHPIEESEILKYFKINGIHLDVLTSLVQTKTIIKKEIYGKDFYLNDMS